MNAVIRMRKMTTPDSVSLPDGQSSHRLNEHRTRNNPSRRPDPGPWARQHPTQRVFASKPLGHFAISTVAEESIEPPPKIFLSANSQQPHSRKFAENFFG
jgi:hypothetical protein